MTKKQKARKKCCPHCGNFLDSIWFTAVMTEEWSWNGDGYFEGTARHSLVTDPEQNVLCPECEKVIGTGLDFGFEKGFKQKYG